MPVISLKEYIGMQFRIRGDLGVLKKNIVLKGNGLINNVAAEELEQLNKIPMFVKAVEMGKIIISTSKQDRINVGKVKDEIAQATKDAQDKRRPNAVETETTK